MKSFPKVNFIGNKNKIASWICDNIPKNTTSFFDAFSGGCSVGYEAKLRNYKVISNDILKVNQLLAKALIENPGYTLSDKDIKIIFDGKPIKGFMYNNFSEVYYLPEECMQLDLYRENINKLDSEYKVALAFSLLRRSMIRKMPYSRFNIPWDKVKQLRDEDYSYKKYGRRRAYHNQTFEFHFKKNLHSYNNAVFDNKNNNIAYNEDIFDLIVKVKSDVIYLDPPYTGTMNNYFSFYSLLDNYYKSELTNPFKNNFINKNNAVEIFNKLFSQLRNFKYWMLSYNNSSHPTKDELINIFSKYSSDIKLIEKDHVYKVTGKEKKKENKEYLFIINNPKAK